MHSMQVIKRTDSTIFLRLPRELWRSCGMCRCPSCQGGEGFWDTLAVPVARKTGQADVSTPVHMPDPFPVAAPTPAPAPAAPAMVVKEESVESRCANYVRSLKRPGGMR